MLDQVRELLADFLNALEVRWVAPMDVLRAAQDVLVGCSEWPIRNLPERDKILLGLVNSKLRLNRDCFQTLLDAAAGRRVALNYHEKASILEWLDTGELGQFEAWIRSRDLDPSLIAFFRPCTREETLSGLREQLRTGFVIRKDARKCSVADRKAEVLQALFGSYIFHAFPSEALHKYFNPDCREEYLPDFYHHLLRFHPQALHRNCAMVFLCIDEDMQRDLSPEDLRDRLYSFIRETYERLANHCFLAILIKPLTEDGESGQWRLVSDLVIYAEKHREVNLHTGYFHPEQVETATREHVEGLNSEKAQFRIANEGFFFKDCFVLSSNEVSNHGTPHASSDPVDLLLLFDKNERDESVIPCPGCRSSQVRGNSYPALGVRSWECYNSICPDRSAFDRGNRYSLAAIIKQQAIKEDDNQIPGDSLRKWKLDVVFGVRDEDVVDMLLRHFTLYGDTVRFVNALWASGMMHGRKVQHEPFAPSRVLSGEYRRFHDSVFFHRFVIDRIAPSSAKPAIPLAHSPQEAEVYEGDCFDVLGSMNPGTIDGAVTSPPYYNARSYSVWPNIYCYLYDMYNSARQVFRVLKPGSIYLFNIFDYFDNENNIVFSAMGKKRMILGAYIINLFRRVGFQVKGNVVWHKGEIEGKRNFNQGNRSPYYQYPFNAWEHILVFQKPGGSSPHLDFPTVLQSKPVMKMVRGENVLGHSAPFPSIIPELLLARMSKGERILDPYSGSMTTGRAAYEQGIRSVSVEFHKEYCELGLRLLEEERYSQEMSLFSNV